MWRFLMLLSWLALLPAFAFAQTAWPKRPISLIVPYPPGGSTDNVARPLVQEWGKVLGQTVVIENRGGAVLTRDLDEAMQLANDYAPEHLALSVSEPWRWVEKVNNAGGVFVGEHSFEVLGDYLAASGNPLGDPSRRPIYLYRPPGFRPGLPAVYFLHGFTGSAHSWTGFPGFGVSAKVQ